MQENKNYDVEEELLDSDAFEDYYNDNSDKKVQKNDEPVQLTLNLKLDKLGKIKRKQV